MEPEKKLDAAALDRLEALLTSSKPDALQIDALWKALQWPLGTFRKEWIYVG